MASMTIRVTVQNGSFVWTRTAVVENLDAVSSQSGNFGLLDYGGSTSTAGRVGLHSYNGIAVAVLMNKAKGSMLRVIARNAADDEIGSSVIPTYMPFIAYGSVATGFTGSLGTSATATDIPDEDLDYISILPYVGAQVTDALYGFKLIS